MNIQLKKIGNSKGIIIPSSILKTLDIKLSEQLKVKVEGKEIILSKVDTFDPQSLEELFLDYKGMYSGKIVFDNSKGKEVW